MRIELYEGVNNTPALRLLAEAWLERLAAGDPQETVINWDHCAFVAFTDDASPNDTPVGVISFEHIKWRRLLWVQLSYVVPSARRQGVHSLLFEALRKHAAKLGVVEIQSGISVTNTEMIQVARKRGSIAKYTVFSYTMAIPPPVSKETIE